MALVKATLKTAILAAIEGAFTAAQNPDANNPTIRQQFASDITDAIDAYIKTANITIAPGLIQVQGSEVAQQNTTPLTIPTALS